MDNRRRQYRDSAQLTGIGLIGIVICVVAVLIVGSPKEDGEAVAIPALEDYLDGTERNALDTLRSIMPNASGIIEYEDGTWDSIRWTESDEWRMWISGDGDTIWE